MTAFYVQLGVIILFLIIHFTLVYRRFKREGDSFNLNRPHSWKRLEDWIPYMMLPLSSKLLDASPIQKYFIETGLSYVTIDLLDVVPMVFFMVFALFGFNIYLKATGWKKK